VFLMREFWVGTVRRYAAGAVSRSHRIWLARSPRRRSTGRFRAGVRDGAADTAHWVDPLRAIALLGLAAGLGLSCFAGWRYTLALAGQPA
jgi:hypothetical protein